MPRESDLKEEITHYHWKWEEECKGLLIEKITDLLYNSARILASREEIAVINSQAGEENSKFF